jgi:hypothetical protein
MNDEARAQKEDELIARRRAAWGKRAPPADAPHTGLALSGGGIRSATFSLGLLQALAEHKRLPHIDYLSTVSGGGYAGSFLGSLFLPRYTDLTVPYPEHAPGDARERETPLEAGERVERLLADTPDATHTTLNVRGQSATTFHPIRWLRENGRYLTPSGAGDFMFMATYYLRGLIGVHTVLGVVLFGVALLFYTLRLLLDAYVPLPQFWALGWAATLRDGGALWWSPILWLAPAVLIAVSVPLVLTYWTVYQRHSRGRTPEDWAIELGPAILGLAALALAWYAEQRSPENPIKYFLLYAGIAFAAALMIRNLYFTLQLGSGWKVQAPLVARARQKLTRGLMVSFYAALALAAIGLIDSLGQSVFIGLVRNELGTWGGGGVGVVALVMTIRRAADWLTGDASTRLRQFVTRNYKLVALGAALLAILALATVHAAVVQAVCWSNRLVDWRAQSASDWAGVAPTRATADLHNELLAWTWLVWFAIAVLIGLSVGFLNNSTFHRFYASRLTRTYLGAANFARLKLFWQKLNTARTSNAATLAPAPEPQSSKKAYGSTVIESHRDDDLALRSYYELESAGPLHLINVALNESVSKTSNLQREDRKGVAMSIGPAGIGVNGTFRRWAAGPNQAGNVLAPPAPDTDVRSSTVERLPLGAWVAISGAAVSTGLGRMSATGVSLLTWIANVRLAYWWKPALQMRAVPPETAARDASPMRPANAYGLMWQEMRGKFIGQACRHWNLSDGGHFENTGAYELIRRRVPLIVVSDNGADANYAFNDVQNLVRRARIDLGAEIRFLTTTELDNLVHLADPDHAPLRALLGCPEDFKPSPRMTSKCVLLACATYTDGTSSLLVFVKPALIYFAPLDVRAYGDANPEFPQQSTADQFFDEAQWESYRKLGLEIGRAVFGHWGALVGAVASANGS